MWTWVGGKELNFERFSPVVGVTYELGPQGLRFVTASAKAGRMADVRQSDVSNSMRNNIVKVQSGTRNLYSPSSLQSQLPGAVLRRHFVAPFKKTL